MTKRTRLPISIRTFHRSTYKPLSWSATIKAPATTTATTRTISSTFERAVAGSRLMNTARSAVDKPPMNPPTFPTHQPHGSILSDDRPSARMVLGNHPGSSPRQCTTAANGASRYPPHRGRLRQPPLSYTHPISHVCAVHCVAGAMATCVWSRPLASRSQLTEVSKARISDSTFRRVDRPVIVRGPQAANG